MPWPTKGVDRCGVGDDYDDYIEAFCDYRNKLGLLFVGKKVGSCALDDFVVLHLKLWNQLGNSCSKSIRLTIPYL